jgi:methylmalonyl-CoA mutase
VNKVGFVSLEKEIESARRSKAEIVVICSSDEEYKSDALQIYNALKDNAIVVMAGFPKDIITELQSEGFKHFIHSKSNVLEELKKYQDLLNIQ